MGKMRLDRLMKFSQVHLVTKKQNQYSNAGLSVPKAVIQ
jgi:hypothetical protein